MASNLGTWANGPPGKFNDRSYGHPSSVGATLASAEFIVPHSPRLSVAKSPEPTQPTSNTSIRHPPLSLDQSCHILAPSNASSEFHLTSTTPTSHEFVRSHLHVDVSYKDTIKFEKESQFPAVNMRPNLLKSTPALPHIQSVKPSITISGAEQYSQNEVKISSRKLESCNDCFSKLRPYHFDETPSNLSVIALNDNQPTELVTASAPRANPRADRLPPSEYYRQIFKMPRLSLEPSSQLIHRALSSETEKEQLQRIQSAASEVIYSRLNNKNRDKYATANVALLHEIRKPMAPKKETWVLERVNRYRQLGESPVFWTKDLLAKIEAPETNISYIKTRDKIGTLNNPVKVRKYGWATSSEVEAQQAEMNAKIKTRRNKNWANNSEVRAERVEKDSNAWGSADPNDTLAEFADSIQAVDSGSVGSVDRPDPGIVGWDGRFMPAPVDWESRLRLKGKKINACSDAGPEFLESMFHHRYPDQLFDVIPDQYILDVAYHADGIGMGTRDWSITKDNMHFYFGYAQDTDLGDLRRLNKASDDDFDRESISSSFEESIQKEVGFAETSEVYSQRYLAYIGKDVTPPREKHSHVQPAALVRHTPAEEKLPILSIYLRPATFADITQITAIYNHYVRHSPRPTDLEVVDDADIRANLDDAVKHKLPFIVAVEKKRCKRKARDCNGMVSNGHRIQNTNPNYQALVEEETIVGFAYAQDWTAHNFCERTSVEIELYVAPGSKILGIGSCLMDKMVQICDPGYIPRGGYHFHCLPENLHLYSEGGGRNVHKMYICVRTWSNPTETPQREAIRNKPDHEGECEAWLKPWLERWGFEQEGHLKEIGARNGRYVDTLQFGRVTMWSPKEGEIPDLLPCTI